MQLFVKNVDVLCLGFQQQVILLLSLQGVWMMILGLSQISQFFGTAELSGMRASNQITDRRAAYFGRQRPLVRVLDEAILGRSRQSLCAAITSFLQLSKVCKV